MTTPTSRASRAALLIVESETKELSERAAVVAGLTAALSRLSELMATVVGPVGYRAVVKRALHLARGDEAWWSCLAVDHNSHATLTGLDDAAEKAGVDALCATVVDVLAHVITLHGSFIGEHLTFRLLRRAWPLLPDEDEDPRAKED